MKKAIKKGCLGILFLLLVLNVQAQDNSDFATWSALGLTYKPTKKWTIELEEQLRLENNSSEVDEYFTELSVSRDLFKNFELGGGLRYIRNNDNQGGIQGYENHFRFHIDASYKHEINDFTLKYRLRYHNKNELGVSVSDGDYPDQYLRFKTALEYNISGWKLDPKLSVELFNHFQQEEKKGLNKIRYTLGTDYKFKKFGKIGVFFRIQKELRVDNPEVTSILGLKYTYTLK